MGFSLFAPDTDRRRLPSLSPLMVGGVRETTDPKARLIDDQDGKVSVRSPFDYGRRLARGGWRHRSGFGTRVRTTR